MAVFGDIGFDSRVRREAETLARAGHRVILVCLPDPRPAPGPPPGVECLQLMPHRSEILPGSPRAQARPGGRAGVVLDFAAWLTGYLRNLRQWGREAVDAVPDADVWHLHDLPALLAIAPRLPSRVRYVYDSHELFLNSGSAGRLPAPARRSVAALERRFARRAAAVITVNPGIADVLASRYGLRRPVVVRNCPPLGRRSDDERDLLREAAGIPPDAPLLLFHGNLVTGRGIELLVRLLRGSRLGRFHFVCMGDGSLAGVLREAAADPATGGRLHLLEPVSPDELPRWVASADLAAVLQQPDNLNLVLSTPNKLYEAISVGVPVLASDLPEIRRVVLGDPDGPLGVLCDPTDEARVSDALDDLLGGGAEVLRAYRERCLRAAAARLNWEVESARLLEVYGAIERRGSGTPPSSRGAGRGANAEAPVGRAVGRRPTAGSLAVKRAIDIVGSAVGLSVAAPLLAAIACALRVTQGSPVLFRQVRPGLSGRPFTLYKFRTMRPVRPGEIAYMTDRERLTRIGRFLRATSLDEIPELWNVLRGDMSLVGPRPLLMEYLAAYTPEQRRRHLVRPGVTGWAVINGRNTLRFDERIRLDVWYFDHWSLRLDILILARTLGRVLSRHGVSVTEDPSLGFPLPGLVEEDGAPGPGPRMLGQAQDHPADPPTTAR